MLRTFYKRPEFLPLALDLTDTNWVIMSEGYATRIPKAVPFSAPVFVLAQVKGKLEVQLSPQPTCDGICLALNATLSQDDTCKSFVHSFRELV